MRLPLLLFAVVAASASAAEVRPWTSTDGTRSFDAEYVSQNRLSVVLRRIQDQKLVTIPVTSLCAGDRAWLSAHEAKPTAGTAVVYDDSAVFDTLHFGETRSTVEKKLRASPVVELTVEEALLGRFGLNGSFRTRKKIGGLACVLSFGWTGEGLLSEVTLQTDPQPASSYPSTLKATWEELANLMTVLHGKPVQDGSYPSLSSLQDGMFIPTHLWNIKPGGSAVLGAARDGKQFQIVVRLKSSQVKPVQIGP